ncbi:unnamed protein product [Cercopithifilaria johnstoni]|uniref:Uncharacterized protein n=1 Tax=Cercopithifilaria johnstoni TaxID=2874296 RepID=A0A8J2LW09_9BILA|nr:unnamed protein product [Cercopithifilaria johnstoni]
MHNRIKDVKSGSDDNGDTVERNEKVCLDGIDTRKYTSFLTLFNTLKERNASSVDTDHTRHLASVQERSEYRNVAVIKDCVPSTPSQRSNAINQNSSGEHARESCHISGELQPITFSNMNLTTIVNGTAPFVQSHGFNSNTAQSIETIVASSEIQVPCSSLFFRRSFEFLTRKKKEIERIEKDGVTRSISFDATYTTSKRKYLGRSSDSDIAPIIVQEMDDRTLVCVNGERIDFKLKQSSEENSGNSKPINKKEVSIGKTTSIEVENYADADKSQGIKTLRNINKILARKLAKTERIAQLLQIQLKFYDKTNDAKFACILADVIDQLKLLLPNDRFRDEALEVLNSMNPSVDVNDEKSVFLNNLLKEIEHDETAFSNSGTLRKYCERLVEYARKHPPFLMELQDQINEVRICLLD